MKIIYIFFLFLLIVPFLPHAKAEMEECSMLFYRQKAEAYKRCKPLAEQGNSDAEKILGDMYYWGWGDEVQRNYREAAKWYKKAAAREQVDAKFSMGVMYEQGKGVAVDYSRAYKWYLSAAKDGHKEAQFNVANMYSKGAGTKQHQPMAAKWYEKAAMQGITEAQYNLANRYATGNGVETNAIEAYKWYTIAYEQGGDNAALANRALIAKKMTKQQIVEARNRASNWRPGI